MQPRFILSTAAMMLVAGVAAGDAAGNAAAQNRNAGSRVVGHIESFDGTTLVVKAADGQKTSVVVPPDQRIAIREKSSLAAIKPGDFVGSPAVEGPDGRLYAESMGILDGELRGLGEGHRVMAPGPQADAGGSAPQNRSMTNATVTGVTVSNRSMTNATVTSVSGSQSGVLKVQYKGGEKDLEVGPDVPVTRVTVKDQSILTPGAAVTISPQISEGGLVGTGLVFVIAD